MAATRLEQIKRVVNEANKKRINRVYYENCFNVRNLQTPGIIQDEQKSKYDQVVLDENKNEQIEFCGFDRAGSYFNLTLSIVSLYLDAQNEFNWRLADVYLEYYSNVDQCRYSYKANQLIDYEQKRKCSDSHETKSTHKIGSLSIETVLPFSLSRILFNGFLTKTFPSNNELEGERVFAKLSISTHPICDKFDYKYYFDTNHLIKTIELSMKRNEVEVSHFLELALEDRIDQSFMFQGQLELIDSGEQTDLMLWGSKVKKFIDSKDLIRKQLNSSKTGECPQESISIWSECGHVINLNRPANCPNLIYGMVSNCYDYASCLYDGIELFRKIEGDSEPKNVDFYWIKSFAELKVGDTIVLTAFEKKAYTIEVCQLIEDRNNKLIMMKVLINSFAAWARVQQNDPIKTLQEAQTKIWALNLHDQKFGFKLANESLLGGKGNSLIELNQRLALVNGLTVSGSGEVGVSVPRGLVVSCVAYQIWLNSNPLILSSIKELDRTRKCLAARSIYLNPLSDKHLTMAQRQHILKEQCHKTCMVLNSCPLPQALKKHLYTMLISIFDEQELISRQTNVNGTEDKDDGGAASKLFAVRSSAVGEDSLETSAAGQMKTILNAKGFESICSAIVDCWSSQFDIEAVTYKSQNGLALNLPMAVVVQELIRCRSAGVAATCDPLTGNTDKLEILGNWGLGEGVVSGKQTDTIRVLLRDCKELYFEPQNGDYLGQISGGDQSEAAIQRVSVQELCCLDNSQIVALANILLWLRRTSDTKEREMEWGITLVDPIESAADASSSGSSSSSSSSSSSASANQADSATHFQVHLLQSRPLTNLSRLSSREIEHELDYGVGSPLDVVSRANFGEVFPGATSSLSSTYFIPIQSTQINEKPFNEKHTYKFFSINSFGFYGQMMVLILSYTDGISRFASVRKQNGQTIEEREASMRALLGTTASDVGHLDDRTRFNAERENPLSKLGPQKLSELFAFDFGLFEVLFRVAKRREKSTLLIEDLTSLEKLLEEMEERTTSSSQEVRQQQQQQDPEQRIKKDIETLFYRLCNWLQLLTGAWKCHMRGTMLSMAYQGIILKMLTQQPAYPSNVDSIEILGDFSLLMQGGGPTESGDISKLLKELIETLIAEGQFESAKQMSSKELFEYLSTSNSKCAKLYGKFIIKNGHRTFKEFDFSTNTWADDPSYIIKSLVARLKHFKPADVERERIAEEERKREQKKKVEEIVSTKIVRAKAFIVNFLLPRARKAVVRREGSKSFLIKIVDKYRRAFRHLGALLCLNGCLPSADLVYQFSIEELSSLVKISAEAGGDLSRLLFKARRRQQRMRLLDQNAFAEPTIYFEEMVKLLKKLSDERDKPQPAIAVGHQLAEASPSSSLVKGLTSCAGCVTGRALVVKSLDDMDQIEQNDILITYSIDISWSVYFYTLAGIVTEVGGIVSHGAVVAREYGIPTLCTAVGACSKFKTGQMVTLNASQGVCYLAEGTKTTAQAVENGGANDAQIVSSE